MIKVNEYENGAVKSLGFESQGVPFTVGVVEPGEYSFATEKEERLTVTVGQIRFRLPGQEWTAVAVGKSLVIPPGVEFTLRADAPASYICEYR